VVVRPVRVHVVCHPAGRLAAAIPSRHPMQHGMSLGRFANRPNDSYGDRRRSVYMR